MKIRKGRTDRYWARLFDDGWTIFGRKDGFIVSELSDREIDIVLEVLNDDRRSINQQ